MKNFNLEEFKNGAIAINRRGEECRFVAHIPDAMEECKLVWVDDHGYVWSGHESGEFGATTSSGADLVEMKPKSICVYVNVYSKSGVIGGYVYPSQGDAEAYADANRLGCKAHKLEIEL